MTPPTLLQAGDLPDWALDELRALFRVVALPADPADIAPFLAEHGPAIRGMALRKTRVDTALLQALPALEIISSYSAGLDNVDVDAVKARGIRLENTSQVLAADVADTAIGLTLALTRDLVNADRFVREGQWPRQPQYPLGRSLGRLRVGIVGLGSIGLAIARRLAAFDARVAWYGPRPKPVDLPWHADILSLARASDLLILTCPLSDATHHLVDAAVLDALGPRGLLVNIARGPVVDEQALITALAEGRIAGAALDVFEHEPEVPAALRQDRRLVLTPHIGSATEETRRGMAEHVVDTLAAHFGLTGPRAA
ncbi:2-hydroxyacid dehydrogenase [Pseudaquabacterium rugosum]|uniref:2-hydroxyacid dehydrogenase n=1 Tax=Pseudaquabacterium rugosum TaxID=2984194 RepID=A0ABU9BI19_9BURK